jgi:F-type H+-transporting ATPase subunit b
VRRAAARKVFLVSMALVTAWSVWTYARTVRASGAPEEGRQAETQAAHPGGGEEHEGPAPINFADFQSKTPPFLAMLVNFALLVGGYYFLGRRPVAAALQSRRDTIAKDIDEAQHMLAGARDRAKVYQAKLEQVEDAKRVARESVLGAGEAERDRIILEAEAKAARLRKDSEFLVDQELKLVREELVREAVVAAVAAAEEMLKSGITQADHERLADEYLADLAAKSLGPQGQSRAS